MSPARMLYLLLAVAGITLTWYYNLKFIDESGGSFDLVAFVADGANNSASQSLSWDLAVACIAGLIWMFFESKRLGLRFYWLYFIATFTIAFAFTFPLFLFNRQGKIEALEQS